MINGIFFSVDGTAQIFGQIISAELIIAAIKEALPQLEKQEVDRLLRMLSVEDLQHMLDVKEAENKNV